MQRATKHGAEGLGRFRHTLSKTTSLLSIVTASVRDPLPTRCQSCLSPLRVQRGLSPHVVLPPHRACLQQPGRHHPHPIQQASSLPLASDPGLPPAPDSVPQELPLAPWAPHSSASPRLRGGLAARFLKTHLWPGPGPQASDMCPASFPGREVGLSESFPGSWSRHHTHPAPPRLEGCGRPDGPQGHQVSSWDCRNAETLAGTGESPFCQVQLQFYLQKRFIQTLILEVEPTSAPPPVPGSHTRTSRAGESGHALGPCPCTS